MNKLKTLGQGSYGRVYLTEDDQGKKHAIKRSFKDKTVDWIGNIKEVDILEKLKETPYIVRIEEIYYKNPFNNTSPMTPTKYKDDKMFFVMECAKCNVKTYVENNKNNFLKIQEIMCQILLGIENMHNLGITHRDIKPENMLVDDNNTVKICDFGMSQFLCESSPSTPGVQTCWYRAPEICLNNPLYGAVSDVWSVGCCFYEFFSEKPYLYTKQTFKNDQDEDKYFLFEMLKKNSSEIDPKFLKQIEDSPYKCLLKNKEILSPIYKRYNFTDRMNISKKLNMTDIKKRELNDLLNKMLCLCYKKRITSSDALNHAFFNNLSVYINDFKSKHKSQIIYPNVNIKSCKERTWIFKIAFSLYNNYEDIPWYKDRIIFHALNIYDIYINYCLKNEKINYTHETETHGLINTKDETYFHFYVCLYIMYKFFSTMNLMMSWKNFTVDEYKSDYYYQKGEIFEEFMINKVLNNNVYRISIYEVSDYYTDLKNFDDFFSLLLVEYSKIGEHSGSVRSLYLKLVNHMTVDKN